MRATNYGAPGSTGFAKNGAGKFGGPGAGWRFGGNYGGSYYGAGRFSGAGGFGKFSAGNAMAFGGAGGFSGMPKGMKGAARFQYLQTAAAASNPPQEAPANPPPPAPVNESQNSEVGGNPRIKSSPPSYLTGIPDVTIVGTDGNDYLVGSSDWLFGELIQGFAGDDFLSTGGAGHDTLQGGEGNDTLVANGLHIATLFGGNGDDLFLIQNGAGVSVFGGPGYDTVRMSGRQLSDESISEFSHIQHSNEIEVYVLEGNLVRGYGDSGDNLIIGNAYSNELLGGDGNDTLVGGGALLKRTELLDNRSIEALLGYDVLIGGAGADLFDLRAYVNEPGAETDDYASIDFDADEGDRLLLLEPSSSQEYRISFRAGTGLTYMIDVPAPLGGWTQKEYTDFSRVEIYLSSPSGLDRIAEFFDFGATVDELIIPELHFQYAQPAAAQSAGASRLAPAEFQNEQAFLSEPEILGATSNGIPPLPAAFA